MFASTSSRAIWRAAVPAIIVTAVAATSASAMRVSPMVVEMGTVGSNAVARIEVQNMNSGSLPFETRVTRLTYEPNGTISEAPADNDFLVFPPQGLLPQGARQVVRVQWVGPAEIPASQAYYLSVNQIPVSLDKGSANSAAAEVQIIYHMKALMIVAPKDATPKVSATSVRAIEYQPPADKSGAPLPRKVPGLEVTLENQGRRHALMSGLKWRFEGKSKDGRAMRLEITPDELNRAIGTGYVAALGGKRTFQIPVAEAFAPGPITLKFVQ